MRAGGRLSLKQRVVGRAQTVNVVRAGSGWGWGGRRRSLGGCHGGLRCSLGSWLLNDRIRLKEENNKR